MASAAVQQPGTLPSIGRLTFVAASKAFTMPVFPFIPRPTLGNNCDAEGSGYPWTVGPLCILFVVMPFVPPHDTQDT